MAIDLPGLNARAPNVPRNPALKAHAQSALNVPNGRALSDPSVRKLQTGPTHRVLIGLTGRTDPTVPTARVRIGPIAPTDLIGQTVPTGRVPTGRIDLIGQIVRVQTGPTDRIVPTGQIVLTDRTGLIDQTVPIARIDRTAPTDPTAQAGTMTATVIAITGSSVVGSTASNGGATGTRIATVTGGATTGASGATAA